MAYRQLVQPNLNPSIVENGAVLSDWYGWCLAYVQNAFGIGWSGSYATQCWQQHTMNSHADNPPSGVWVPIFFSGYGGMGHVAIYKDGIVYSSPWHHKAVYDEMPSIAQTARIYNVTYVGWAEGIAGRQLVESVSDPLPTPQPTVHPYTIQLIAPKQIKTNKQPTRKWGMNYDNLPAISNNPEGQVDQGTVLTITGICHHQVGYDYYLEDVNNPSGYNTLDCDDIPSPVPLPTPPPLPTPVISPPVIAPSREPYPIKVTIPKYASMTDALNKQNSTGTLAASATNYYAFNTLPNGIVSITTQPGTPQGIFINPAENVVNIPTPVITDNTADVMKTWKWGYATHEAAEYKVVRNYTVRDLIHNGRSIDIKAGHTIDIYGSFVMNGTTYLRPLTSVDDKGLYYWYGIPTSNIHTGEPYLENEYNIVDQAQEKWESFYDKVIKTIEGIFHKRK